MRFRGKALILSVGLLGAAGAWFVFDRKEPRISVDRSFLPGALEKRLFVAEAGEVKVYDIDEGHSYRGRVKLRHTDKFKGIAASVSLGVLFLSSHEKDELICLDLVTFEERWRRRVGAYIDSLAITPDGMTLCVPCREESPWRWYFMNATDGAVVGTVEVPKTPKDARYKASRRKEWDGPSWTSSSGPHNTWCSPDGARMYLAAMTSPYVFIADVATRRLLGRVGPFDAGVRPFAVSADEAFVFACVDGLLGFEVGAANTEGEWGGTSLHRVKAKPGPERRKSVGHLEEWAHNTPSHGIATRPGTAEVWVVDGIYGFLHVFDSGVMPPRFVESIALFEDDEDRPEPGWISFGLDGRFAYSSTGHVLDATTRAVAAHVEPSERIIEIDFRDGLAIAASHR